MKARFFRFFILLIFSTMVFGSFSAFAQDPGTGEPHARPEKPERGRALHRPSLAESVPNRSFHSSLVPGQSLTDRSSEMAAPEIALGQPGFNFRIDQTFGITSEPYPVNTTHLNGPGGLYIDSSNNVYVAESEGSRVLRFNSTGTNTLAIGWSGRWDVADGFFDWPQDVHVDNTGDIWVVDASRVTRYSSSGVHEMSYPANEDERYDCLFDSLHFCYPQGLAFDSLGRLYVSDTENNRIQVFNISGGNLVYWTTIGTGIAGTGSNQFNYPTKLAINSANELFVADMENHRIQKCTYGVSWTCSTFHGVSGVPGNAANQLYEPWGITVDASGNVFIADESNWRVKKCTSSGACSDFAYPDDPTDVAVDSSGNVYVSTWYNSYTVEKYNSFGNYLGDFAGTAGLTYVGDSTHIYIPHGIGVDPAGNIYVSERMGNRWLKIDPSGGRVWTKGTPGMRINNPAYFGENLYGNPAISSGNLLFLPSGNQRCVRVYDLNGIYQNLVIGTCHGSTGDTGTLLGNVAGVAISPLNGNIYVVDRGNRKVKIYNSSLAYQGYLGQGLGSVGLGNGSYQFDEPMGIAIDSTGSIYVADRMNHRVQKYNSSSIYQYTIGVTDWCDWPYGYLCAPSGVAVDSQNRLYVAENWNSRVTIYDSTGAYLSTISGDWGLELGRFKSPAGVAVAPDGTVYVTEQYNHRVQVFKPGVSGWVQENLNGFGDPDVGIILAIESFNGSLYSAGYQDMDPNQLYKRTSSGWTKPATTGLGHASDWAITELTDFEGNLYAGTGSQTFGGEVLRSADGLAWQQVNTGGFGDLDYVEVELLVPNNGFLYASIWSDNSSKAGQIWRSDTGAFGTWSQVAPNGFGDPNNDWIAALEVHNGALYAGTENYDRNLDQFGIAELWRCVTCDGSDWSQVTLNWTNLTSKVAILDMEAFNNQLYVYTVNTSSQGGEVWRCQVCNGTDWQQVVSDGLGDSNRDGNAVLESHQGALFFAIRNYLDSGLEVFKSTDGLSWSQIGFNGFGDPNNYRIWPPAAHSDGNKLYIGTYNWANGGEIWKLQNLVFLPFLIR